MADPTLTEGVVYGAAFLGTLARTLVPYWDRLRTNPETVFEKKFLGTAAIGLVTSAIIAVTLFVPMLQLVDNAGNATLGAVFALVFTSALGMNELINWGVRSSPAPSSSLLKGEKTGTPPP